MKAWRTIASVMTADGPLELRQRGDGDFLIVIDGRVLMTSSARRSEEALSTLGCAAVANRPRPRVLIGGLGMGYTLRAALDALPVGAEVVVAELTAEVVAWCKGPLRELTSGAVHDPRVTIELGDVADVIGAGAGRYDAILLDLYEGPHQATQRREDPFYGPAALARSHRALRPGGVFAVWSEEADAPFAERLATAGFAVSVHRSGSGRLHVVYLATKGQAPARTSAK